MKVIKKSSNKKISVITTIKNYFTIRILWGFLNNIYYILKWHINNNHNNNSKL